MKHIFLPADKVVTACTATLMAINSYETTTRREFIEKHTKRWKLFRFIPMRGMTRKQAEALANAQSIGKEFQHQHQNVTRMLGFVRAAIEAKPVRPPSMVLIGIDIESFGQILNYYPFKPNTGAPAANTPAVPK